MAAALTRPSPRRRFAVATATTSAAATQSTTHKHTSRPNPLEREPHHPPPPPRVVLSGIQPTGIPHLGNYLGALKNWTRMQDDLLGPGGAPASRNQVLYSIVDLHAITQPQDPKLLRKNIHDMAIALLACGIDPERSVLFRQSRVPQHAELAWILFCRTPIGWLSRMHQWKSKVQSMKEAGTLAGGETMAESTMQLLKSGAAESAERTTEDGANDFEDGGPGLGLLAYPVLQAADILVIENGIIEVLKLFHRKKKRANEVPIGEDQLQHMNLTSMAARSFNAHYKKNVFPIPRGVFASSTSKRIMSLRNPTSKMSKSDPSDQTRINIDDTADAIRQKIRRATVDSTRGITYDPERRPGIANLLRIQAAFMEAASAAAPPHAAAGAAPGGVSVEELAERQANMSNQEFKETVAECVVEGLRGVREEVARHRADGGGAVEQLLRRGEERAREAAERTMEAVRRAVGFR
ncbi:hypothetical protein DFJ73DRAFT_769435 [Zopfochytrium polystomum]|nr:hypothetical protein DFJ73DRAFT_769435 [Zopfochytrium polystomum]